NLAAIHHKLRIQMELAGARITGIYYCPHLPKSGCTCRKPKPGMVHLAAFEHGIDLTKSWLIGDKPEDIACGHAAGCRTILVLTGKTQAYDPTKFSVVPDEICNDLPGATEYILDLRPSD